MVYAVAKEQDFGDRLLELMGRMSGAELGRKIGVSSSSVNAWVNGTSDPKRANLVSIARFFGVDVGWLATGEGARAGMSLSPAPGNTILIPRLNVQLAAGNAGAASDERIVEYATWDKALLSRMVGSVSVEQLAYVEVVGDSMEPEMRSGSWVLCERCEGYLGPAIYALRSPDGLIVKRLQRTNGSMQVISSNPAYPPLEVEMKKFEQSFVVIARVRLIERAV